MGASMKSPRRSTKHTPDTRALERALLGGFLLRPTLLDLVRVAAQDFAVPAHGEIYGLLRELHAEGSIDLALFMDTVAARGLAKGWGGETALVSLQTECVSVELVPSYAERLREHRIQRDAETALRRALEDLAQNEGNVAARLAATAKVLEGLTGRNAVAALPWLTPSAPWLVAEPETRPYLLHVADGPGALRRGAGLLPRSKVGMIQAEGGAGKTFALCGLALAVVTRSPWLGAFPVGEGLLRRAVLVLGEEDAPELRRRLCAQAQAMGLTASEHGDAIGRILALPGSGLETLALTQAEERDEPTRTRFADNLFAHLQREGEKHDGWDVLILDPLSRFAGPDVEKDNSAGTRLIQTLERFTTLPGNPSVIVAHHTNKTSRGKDEDGRPRERSAAASRGSSALTDGARWVGDLAPQPGGFASFSIVKSNYGAVPDTPTVLKRAAEGGLRAATSAELAQLETTTRETAAKKRSEPDLNRHA